MRTLSPPFPVVSQCFAFFPPCHWWNPHSVSWCLGPVAGLPMAPRQLWVFTELGIMDKAINSCIYYTLVCLFFFFHFYFKKLHFIRSDMSISQPHKCTSVPVYPCARRGLVINISVLKRCSLNAPEAPMPKAPIKNCRAVIHANIYRQPEVWVTYIRLLRPEEVSYEEHTKCPWWFS